MPWYFTVLSAVPFCVWDHPHITVHSGYNNKLVALRTRAVECAVTVTRIFTYLHIYRGHGILRYGKILRVFFVCLLFARAVRCGGPARPAPAAHHQITTQGVLYTPGTAVYNKVDLDYAYAYSTCKSEVKWSVGQTRPESTPNTLRTKY